MKIKNNNKNQNQKQKHTTLTHNQSHYNFRYVPRPSQALLKMQQWIPHLIDLYFQLLVLQDIIVMPVIVLFILACEHEINLFIFYLHMRHIYSRRHDIIFIIQRTHCMPNCNHLTAQRYNYSNTINNLFQYSNIVRWDLCSAHSLVNTLIQPQLQQFQLIIISNFQFTIQLYLLYIIFI